MEVQVSGDVLAQALHEYLNKRGLGMSGSHPMIFVNGEECKGAAVIYGSPKTFTWDGAGFVASDQLARE